MNKILILGGYGNFGKRIAQLLTRMNIQVIIAGRDLAKAQALAGKLTHAQAVAFDVKTELAAQLEALNPSVVINTCGPFQTSDYAVARICIQHGVHYIDLADGRDFVTGISALDEEAMAQNVTVISGASTVPGLSSAVIEHFRPVFSQLESLRFGIAPGQKAERGLATTQAILGYVGQKLKPCAGYPLRYGWQDLHVQTYPTIGRRLMANCDIPDLDLLPRRYGIEKIRFSAGMENPLVHMGLWLLSWLVRVGLVKHLERHAKWLLKASNAFDFLGSADGGMHVVLRGKDRSGQVIEKSWFIVALDGDGPYIPTIPAVLLAKKLTLGHFGAVGAMQCVGLVSLEEYMQALAHFKVKTYESTAY